MALNMSILYLQNFCFSFSEIFLGGGVGEAEFNGSVREEER